MVVLRRARAAGAGDARARASRAAAAGTCRGRACRRTSGERSCAWLVRARGLVRGRPVLRRRAVVRDREIGIGNLAVLGAVSVDRPDLLEHLADRVPGRMEPHIAQAFGLGILTAGLAALVLASATDSAAVLVAASVLAGHRPRLRDSSARRTTSTGSRRRSGAARSTRALHVRVSRRRAARDRGGRALRLHDPDDRGRRLRVRDGRRGDHRRALAPRGRRPRRR